MCVKTIPFPQDKSQTPLKGSSWLLCINFKVRYLCFAPLCFVLQGSPMTGELTNTICIPNSTGCSLSWMSFTYILGIEGKSSPTCCLLTLPNWSQQSDTDLNSPETLIWIPKKRMCGPTLCPHFTWCLFPQWSPTTMLGIDKYLVNIYWIHLELLPSQLCDPALKSPFL